MNGPAPPLRSKALPWILASLPFVFLVAWFWSRGPGLDADDFALTLMHAQALADGRPYNDTGYIPTPIDIAPPFQPPGLPIILAGVMKVTGGFHWPPVKVVMALIAFPFFLLSGLYFAHGEGRDLGLTVMFMAIVGLAAQAPHGALYVQSDLGLATLVWAVIFLLDRRPEIDWKTVTAVFFLGSFAVAYRLLGVIIVPTIALFALANRQRHGLRLAAPLAVWGVLGGVALALGGWSLVASQVYSTPSARVLLRSALQALRFYGRPAAAAHLYPLPGDLPNDVFHVASLALAGLGLLWWTRSAWRSAAWIFGLTYGLALLEAGARTSRYLAPLHPILIFGFLYGLRLVTRAVRPGWTDARARHVVNACGAVVASMALILMLVNEPRAGGYLPDLPAAQELFAHLEEQGPTDQTRVAFTQPRTLAWSTGIRSMVLLGAPPERTIREMDRLRITHVVLDRLGLEPGRTDPMRVTIAANECRFVKTFDNGSFEVYRLLPSCPSREA